MMADVAFFARGNNDKKGMVGVVLFRLLLSKKGGGLYVPFWGSFKDHVVVIHMFL